MVSNRIDFHGDIGIYLVLPNKISMRITGIDEFSFIITDASVKGSWTGKNIEFFVSDDDLSMEYTNPKKWWQFWKTK